MDYKLRTFCLCAIALALAFPVSASWAAARVGVVGNVEGNATATDENNTQRPLKTGSDIFPNDVIETDDSSSAQLLFVDKSALTLTPGSQVKIDKFVYDPAAAAQGVMSLQEMKGAIRFIGGALSKENHVEIKTPVSTVGIRGGIEETHITPQGDAADALFIYGHDMTVQDKNGKNMVLTEFGSGAQVKKGLSAPVRLSRQAVEDRFRQFHHARSAPARKRHLMARRHAIHNGANQNKHVGQGARGNRLEKRAEMRRKWKQRQGNNKQKREAQKEKRERQKDPDQKE